MNKLINEILKEAKEDIHDDLFFQPKDIEKREKEQERERREILRKIKEKGKIVFAKIKLGLQNIRAAYENKNWGSESEELFLEIFSNFHVNKKYDKWWKGHFLLNEKNVLICVFDSKHDTLWVSYDDVWEILAKKFHWKYVETQSFMEQMLNKYFKLYGFTSSAADKKFFKS